MKIDLYINKGDSYMDELWVLLLLAFIIWAFYMDRKRIKNFTPEQRIKYEETKQYLANRKIVKQSKKRQKKNERGHILGTILLVSHFMKK